ncbi:MAG: hypothetical protein J6Q39_04180 [Bacteroidales bacterium]|nr:hypothetical protein [Bacteroidales bacterium]
MKKYLKTIKDVEALRDTDTKILYEIENGGVPDPREYYKFVNGVLCCFSNDTLVSYNTMLVCKRIKYYIEVEDEKDYIGKLGWFWDFCESDDGFVNVLEDIVNEWSDKYLPKGSCCGYRHFRPLTPEEVEKYTGYKVVKED